MPKKIIKVKSHIRKVKGKQIKVKSHKRRIDNSGKRYEWLEKLLKLGFSEKQKGYYQWLYENSEQINIVNPESDPELNKLIQRFLERYSPEKKGCFSTAMNAATTISDVEYVEGYVDFQGIPIEHGWNKYKGKYFDITSYLFFHSGIGEHYKIIDISREKLVKDYMLKYERTGPYLFDYYKDEIKNSNY